MAISSQSASVVRSWWFRHRRGGRRLGKGGPGVGRSERHEPVSLSGSVDDAGLLVGAGGVGACGEEEVEVGAVHAGKDVGEIDAAGA